MASLTEMARLISSRVQATPLDSLTLVEFVRSGRVVRIISSAIGEEVLVAADDADINLWLRDRQASRSLVIYRPHEVMALRGVTPNLLRRLHEVKKLFGGEIENEPDGFVLPSGDN